MQILKGIFLSWLLASIFIVPHLLIRLGKWKDWYLSPTVLPFAFKRGVHLGIPFSFLFLFAPCMAFVPGDPYTKLGILLSISAVGFISGIVLALSEPHWAKPGWQRQLEERFTRDEIAAFLPIWRHMDHQKWGRLIETEEGLEQLVQMARERQR